MRRIFGPGFRAAVAALVIAGAAGIAGCAQQTPGLLGSSSVFDASTASTEDIAAALQRDGRVTIRGVLFETDSDRLSPSGQDAALRLAAAMANNPGLKVAVVGHTDDTGAFRYNLQLSERRARSLAQAITAQGISQDRVVPVGVGPIAPVADNSTDAGRAQNRRVEVVVVE